MTDQDKRILTLASRAACFSHHAEGRVGGHAGEISTCPHPNCLAVREAEANLLAEPTEQPYDAKGRWMLNSYGRQCYERGYETGNQAAVGADDSPRFCGHET